MVLMLVFLATYPLMAPADITVPLSQTVLLGRIGHGFNMGDALEAPHEGAWGVTLQDTYFDAIAKAGFQSVRVPISWAAHVGPAPNFTLEPAFLARVDWVVREAHVHQLTVILDYHNDDALMKNPDANAGRFVTIWKEIALHYFAEPESVIFELLNEPNGALDAPHWNALLRRTLAKVRETNPQRIIIVGPVQWNSINALPGLELPTEDQRLAVTFHYYDPMHFTHQGAEWIDGSTAWLGTHWVGTAADRQVMTDAFAQASAWGRVHQRPMFLGEFGSYSTGDLASRVRWTRSIVDTAAKLHLPWTYWEFCAGFGAYNPKANKWRQPLLKPLKENSLN